MGKHLWFSIGVKDCRFDYLKGSGAGGQKRNKTSSAVRCTHIASGAVGYSEQSRSQHQNKADAFYKMANTKEFRSWHRLECSRRSGKLDEIRRNVEQSMRYIKVEGKNQQGCWEELGT